MSEIGNLRNKIFMEKFHKHTGLTVPLFQANIDTDQIIPKQFLKSIERTGFGKSLFHDWRFCAEGNPLENFVLNQPRYAGASILLAGANFGCGSSREHAPWALMDFGFRAIIATSFADIFYNNSLKNGLMLVRLPEREVSELVKRANDNRNYQLTIDLENRTVRDEFGLHTNFAIDDFSRRCLLEGLDDIGLTLQHEAAISQYEAAHPINY